jgi:hypothetical protein
MYVVYVCGGGISDEKVWYKYAHTHEYGMGMGIQYERTRGHNNANTRTALPFPFLPYCTAHLTHIYMTHIHDTYT